MVIDRQKILEKITALFERSLLPQEVYQWALGIAVSKEFEAFSAQDPVAATVVQKMMEINEDAKISLQEMRILEYYRQCLVGQREYVPLSDHSDLPDLSVEILERWADAFRSRAQSPFENILHRLRVYVYVFAGYMLISNFWLLFMLGGPWSGKRISAVITFPFIVYGFLLVLPMRIIVGTPLFFVALPLSILAVAYSWFGCFQEIFCNGAHFFEFFVNLLLSAIPAIIAVWLLVYEKYLRYPNRGEQG